MRFATANRGRVPFAIVGVILLVTSAAYAAGISTTDSTADRSLAAAVEREAQASAQTAIHAGVRTAVRRAAQTPLTHAANTTPGRAIRGEDPFRRYLRLLIYRHVRLALTAQTTRRGSVSATVELPPIRELESVSAAIDRVYLRPTPGRRGIRVRISDVAVRLVDRGRRIDTTSYSPSASVKTPILALHRAMERYERRVNSTPPAGVPARFTRSLYVLAWARGYAQHAGHPIDNVVANRDLVVLLNRAMIAEQLAVFDAGDPASLAALGTGLRRTGHRLLGVGTPHRPAARALLAPDGLGNATKLGSPGLGPSRHVSVGVNGSADAAYRAILGSDGERLRAILAATPSVSAARPAEVPDKLVADMRLDLARLRDQVRDIGVDVRIHRTVREPPAGLLAERVRQRFDALRVPDRSVGAIPRSARLAVRAVYLRAVITHLEGRDRRSRTVLNRVHGQVSTLRRDLGRLGATPALQGAPDTVPGIVGVKASPVWVNASVNSAPAHCDPSQNFSVTNINWFGINESGSASSSRVTLPRSLGGPASLLPLSSDALAGVADRIAATLERTPTVPSGLPLAPVPGHWYATVNGWTVEATAKYDRLAIAAPAGTPSPSPLLRYVRQNATIRMDLDGDGQGERIGRTAPIRVRLKTSVVVVVPPGGEGVGDRTARRERSASSPAAGRSPSSAFTTNRSACSPQTSLQPTTRPTSHSGTEDT